MCVYCKCGVPILEEKIVQNSAQKLKRKFGKDEYRREVMVWTKQRNEFELRVKEEF